MNKWSSILIVQYNIFKLVWQSNDPVSQDISHIPLILLTFTFAFPRIKSLLILISITIIWWNKVHVILFTIYDTWPSEHMVNPEQIDLVVLGCQKGIAILIRLNIAQISNMPLFRNDRPMHIVIRVVMDSETKRDVSYIAEIVDCYTMDAVSWQPANWSHDLRLAQYVFLRKTDYAIHFGGGLSPIWV